MKNESQKSISLPCNIVKAAEAGDADAQFNLGMLYHNGECGVQDDAEAFIWWRKAAVQGHAKAQFCLGCCYDCAWGGGTKPSRSH